LLVIFNEFIDKQLLYFDRFGCGLVEGNIAVISIPLDPYNFALVESYDRLFGRCHFLISAMVFSWIESQNHRLYRLIRGWILFGGE
jgi:hypothetical protein